MISYPLLSYWSSGSLTHWGRVTHIWVGKLTIIASDNGLSPGQHQAIIWTNAGILLIGPLGTKFNEIFIEIHAFSFKKMHLKMSSAKWRPFCLSPNVLNKSLILSLTHWNLIMILTIIFHSIMTALDCTVFKVCKVYLVPQTVLITLWDA